MRAFKLMKMIFTYVLNCFKLLELYSAQKKKSIYYDLEKELSGVEKQLNL